MIRFKKGIRYLLQIDLKSIIRIMKMLLFTLYATFLVRFIPLRYYYWKYLINSNMDSSFESKQPIQRHYRQFHKVTRLLPWKVTCIIESIAFHLYCKSINIFTPIHIGLKNDGKLSAHAWCISHHSSGFSALNKF